MTTLDSEEALEQAAMALLNDLGWESVNSHHSCSLDQTEVEDCDLLLPKLVSGEVEVG